MAKWFFPTCCLLVLWCLATEARSEDHWRQFARRHGFGWSDGYHTASRHQQSPGLGDPYGQLRFPRRHRGEPQPIPADLPEFPSNAHELPTPHAVPRPQPHPR